ncbi:hypothetical protein [Zavarzinia sp.]|uniref:hypothetical protein n=1 Tax=Zavarzinia sp. TaxID=2027920 RepID=UPI003BB7F7F4
MNTAPQRPTAEEWRAAARKWLGWVRDHDAAIAANDTRSFGAISRAVWDARDELNNLDARERAADAAEGKGDPT